MANRPQRLLGLLALLCLPGCIITINPPPLPDVVDTDVQRDDVQGVDVQGIDVQGIDVQGVDVRTTDVQNADTQSLPPRSPYELCEPALTACTGSTSCVAANTTVDTQGRTKEFCTRSCTIPSDCPASTAGTPLCIVVSGSGGQCYFGCNASDQCPTGYTCGGPAGMTPYCIPNVNTPPPCGHVGELCCTTGTQCSDSGSVCGSDNRCGRAPYAGCPAAAVGTSCLSGANATGSTIDTDCIRPLISNPGQDGFCSASCSTMSDCPTSTISSRPYACYRVMGSTGGQCMLDCTNNAACPANTVCVSFNVEGGATVEACMPTPAP